MSKILVLHGPNLNLLGDRETQHYGHASLEEIDRRLAEQGKAAGVQVSSFQDNGEGPLIERVHAAKTDGTDYIIIIRRAIRTPASHCAMRWPPSGFPS